MAINSKSTKTEILEAYNAMKEKLDAMDAMKDDPAKTIIVAENKRVAESAANVVEAGILNDTIVGQYKDLQTEISNMQQKLKELYGIEAQANTMVALINAAKEKELEIQDKQKAMKEALDNDMAEKKAAMQEQIDLLIAQRDMELDAKRRANDELKKELKIERERDEEEYEYNLKRARKQDADKWLDEKNAREKILSDREVAVLARENVVDTKESYIAELEVKVEAIPNQIKEAFEDGQKKGKADADKSHAFEIRAINTKNEYEQKMLMDQVSRLEATLVAERTAKEVLQEKLDEAYRQMKELASETVKSSGGVKILDRENTGK